jgi:flagellar assembly protein FliH
MVVDRFEQRPIQVNVNPQTAQTQKQEGYDAGYQEGLAQARADVIAATEDSNRRVRRALAALSEAVNTFDQRQTVALGDVEDAIVAGAFALARSILQRELMTATDPGGDALARALQLVPDRGDVIARLHPDDAATLNMERVTSTGRTVHLVADPAIELGGCIVEVGAMRIDAQLSSALQHAARAMSLDESIVESNEPLIGADVEAARMEAAIAALQQASLQQVDLPIQDLEEDAVIESTEAAPRAPESKSATGRGRKSSRKTASEAP